MKPMNFPARKLKRKIDANNRNKKLRHIGESESSVLLRHARNVRTKVTRSN